MSKTAQFYHKLSLIEKVACHLLKFDDLSRELIKSFKFMIKENFL